MTLTREQYVQNRVAVRYQQRGDPIVLRRVSQLSGPVPYPNPPDVSSDLVVVTGVTAGGQAYLGISGKSIIGRLVPGDQVVAGAVTWTVGTMPTNVLTDTHGIPIVDGSGNPSFGTPSIYHADSLAYANKWNCIPVSATGSPNPAASIGQAVSLVFAADVTGYAVSLSLQKMTAMGWTEVDALGFNLAAAAFAANPPKVNDRLIWNGRNCAIISTGIVSRRGYDFLYPVQAR